ncbi:MAG TPA: hypothetical protein VF881_05945 [Polyangiaceae bacterium]
MDLRTWTAIVLLGMAGCRRAHQVGDHVLIDWRGGEYPAVIVGVEGPAKFHVHYDGFSEDWDETIPATRIRARLSTTPGAAPPAAPRTKTQPKPGASAGASASASAAPQVLDVYRLGDHVRVEWHGSIYPATIIGVLGDDRYRVHYDGHGNEWDEDIPMNRVQRKGVR